MRRLNRALLAAAQRINRKTSWADGLKNRLGLWRLAQGMLARPVGEASKREILDSLDETVVSGRVAELAARGVDDPVFLVLLVERMGDIVACEPVPRHLKGLAPRATVKWILLPAFRELAAHNPDIDEVVEVASLSEGVEYCERQAKDPRAVLVNLTLHNTSCAATNRIFPNRNNPLVTAFTYYAIGGLLETFSLAAGLPRLQEAPRFHFRRGLALPPQLRGRDYIVLHCRSNSPERDWSAEKWRELAGLIAGEGLFIVEIGERGALDGMPDSLRLDFTGRRDLQELAFAVSRAKCFAGVESGFGHIANATRTPSAILAGSLGNFHEYFPYSGDFARSDSFRIVRAPGSRPARDISVQDAFEAIRTLPPRG